MTGDWSVAATQIWDVSPLAGAEWANMMSRPESRADLVFAGNLVAASTGRAVRLWDPSTGEVVADIGRESAADRPADVDAAIASITAIMTALYDGELPMADRVELLDDLTGVDEAVAGGVGPRGDGGLGHVEGQHQRDRVRGRRRGQDPLRRLLRRW